MEVTNVVASIIAALGNGKELFRRMIGKKGKRKGRKPTLSEEEAWLMESLSCKPQQVHATFKDSVAQHGRRFEKGDSAAHSSLAHTLLVLNAGLVNLINTVLHRDSKYNPTSSRALLQLSENATRDTLDALSHLSLRLSRSSTLKRPESRIEGKEDRERRGSGKKRRNRDGRTAPAIRGAWVRPKPRSLVSGASSQVSFTSQKRPDEEKRVAVDRRKRHSSPSRKKQEIHGGSRGGSPDIGAQQREPSMVLVSSEVYLPSRHEREARSELPYRRDHSHQSRPRPQSAATFMTGSTKIGEIPSKPARQLYDDTPLVEYITDRYQEPEAKSRKLRRGFKFWKHKQEPAPAAVLAN